MLNRYLAENVSIPRSVLDLATAQITQSDEQVLKNEDCWKVGLVKASLKKGKKLNPLLWVISSLFAFESLSGDFRGIVDTNVTTKDRGF